MSEYRITAVSEKDHYTNEEVDRLLRREQLRRDRNLNYTCAMLDEEGQVIATGSLFRNTLRCLAVDSTHQGEALMNDVVSHLIEEQYRRGNYHLFLYTKCSASRFFGSLGFYEIIRVPEQLVFMENRPSGFRNYLAGLRSETKTQLIERGIYCARFLPIPRCCEEGQDCGGSAAMPRISAIVMNANPFTRGHRYLIEKALAESELLHLFLVSEDSSLIPYAVRKKLVLEGCSDLRNIVFHDSGSYIISSATFPAYFQKDQESVIRSQASLDLRIFTEISPLLGIRTRYVGTEPSSFVTGLYNELMQTALPEAGIACRVLPRLMHEGVPVSASTVRTLLREGDFERLRPLVPESTYRFFRSEEAESVLRQLREVRKVTHY